MNKFKFTLKILLVLAIIAGAYFGVRYIIKIRNTAIAAYQQTVLLSKFMLDTFPDEVKAFEAANTPAK